MSEDKYARAEALRRDGNTWNEVAEEIGVHRRTLYRWRNSGKVEDPQKNGQNGGSASDITGTLEPNGGGGATLSEAKRRKQFALAEKHELDLAERRGELVTRDHVRDVHLRYRSAVEAIPRVLLSEVTDLLDISQREALPILEKLVDLVKDHVGSEIERWMDDAGHD